MCSSGRVRSACVERDVMQWSTLARRWRTVGELGLPCVAERMHPRQQDGVFFIQFHAAEHRVRVPLGGDVLCRARATGVPRVDSWGADNIDRARQRHLKGVRTRDHREGLLHRLQ